DGRGMPRMSMNPASVANRSFEVVRRGFDPDAVRQFLREVAEEIVHRDNRIAQLERRLASAQRTGRVAASQHVGEEVAAVLAGAELAANQILSRAKTDGELFERRLHSAAGELAGVYRSMGEHLMALERLAGSGAPPEAGS